MTPEPLRDFTLGPETVTGFYERFMSLLGRGLSEGLIAAIAWDYLAHHPPGADYHITADISAVLLIKVALLLWTAWIALTSARALWNGARWLKLEAGGMQWAMRDGETRRVTFWRGQDQILRTDNSTPASRAAEDAAGRRYRLRAASRDCALLVLLTAAYYCLPAAFDQAQPYLSVDWAARFARWDVPELARLAWLFFLLIPRGVEIAMTALEAAIHAAGAQFMPGAKIRA